MEEVMGGLVNCRLPSGRSPASHRLLHGSKEVAGNNSTGLFPELTLQELVLLPAQQILLYLSAATGS
jgi:hypothetical protein